MMKDSSNNKNTIKFLCSYGGKILPRTTDGKLRYIGGYTRVLSVDRSISFTELMEKLFEFCGSPVKLKCQLPDDDLDTLVSVTSDDDLANVVEEYDRVSLSSSHPPKIRAILFGPKFIKTTTPSLSPDSSASNSPHSSKLYTTCSPNFGSPVGAQKDAGRFGYQPAFRGHGGSPVCLHQVPYWNYNYRQ